ncbi:hypothetical protein SPHINGO8BC_50736 [Sphingobacterium multivorum]|jgi:hypothetical protein|uniref:Uncharacterized protein n=1 Tax=Sphingobacterium multivorum TaxID=28454 RepID=A0A654CEW0_SPHMU|nr:hypothetical protein SPHINGO8BC_50736 [Sphingobacterium multivorum]
MALALWWATVLKKLRINNGKTFFSTAWTIAMEFGKSLYGLARY